MNQQTGSLIGMLTVAILLFGGVSILVDARNTPGSGSSQLAIAGLLFAMAAFRIWRLVVDHRRAQRRKDSRR